MNNGELSARVATRTCMSKAGADAAVSAVFSTITDPLANAETVTINGLGIFSTKSRPARQDRGPRTGESIAIAASKAPSFKAGKPVRAAVS